MGGRSYEFPTCEPRAFAVILKSMRILTVILAFTFTSSILSAQTKKDSIDYMTNLSLNYVNTVFNKHDMETAAIVWSHSVYLDLRDGFVKCDNSFQNATHKKIRETFKRALIQFNELPRNAKFKISNLYFTNTSDTVKVFSITFLIENYNSKDALSKHVILDWVTLDNGKTWKLGRDNWAYRFADQLCRQPKQARHKK